MKKTIILIFLLAAFITAGKDYILKNNQSAVYRFDAPAGKHALLFFRARIKLPSPAEAWGFHALEVKLNGKTLKAPCNKAEKLIDPQNTPPTETAVCDSAGKLFLRADSDWQTFNASSGDVYSNTQRMNQVNQTELNNVFYNFVFPLKDLKKNGNTLTLKVFLPDHVSAYPVEITGLQIAGFSDRIVFHRDWLQAVYPWSFPTLSEIKKRQNLVVALGETGLGSFSIYNFKSSTFKVPDDLQLYRLDNTLIPGKRKQMEDHHIPNTGELYVPELLTPVKKGTVLQLPQGTTTFLFRYCGKRAGNYKIAGIPVDIRVLNFTLPDHETLPVENGLYIMASQPQKQNIYPELREYGITQILISPWNAPIKLKIENDKLHADFRRLDAKIKEIQSWKLSRRQLLFGTSEPILNQLHKLTGEGVDGKAFQRRFKEFIRLFFDHADQLNLKIYLSLYDEANFQKKIWHKTQILTKIATTVPNSRMWATVTDLVSAAYFYDTLGYRKGRDLAVTHPFLLIGKPDTEVQKGILIPDQKTTAELRARHFRGEYMGVTSYPGTGNRYQYGFRSRHSDLEVYMGFAFWWGDMKKPNTKPRQWYYVSYPFFEKTTGLRYSTIGWEAIRAGIDDYRYAELASQKLIRKYGQAEGKKILKKILAVKHSNTENIPTDYFNHVRNQLIKIIEVNQ